MSASPFHHFTMYPGTKKMPPLRIRNPSILPSQIMPSPSEVPFNVSDMPWSYAGKPGQLMEFNAVIRPGPYPTAPTSSLTVFTDLRKRKPEPEAVPIPPKLFLSEEAMASHFDNLHLSTDYTSHNIEPPQTNSMTGQTTAPSEAGGLSPTSSLDDDMSLGEPSGPSSSHHVFMSPQELEERLRKAQRIAVCEEVRKLDNRGEILPKALLERFEKPCTALVIWQPPASQALQKLVSETDDEKQEKKQKEQEARSSSDMQMAEDEPLPDLPDYDDDLDFEENNNNMTSMGDFNSMDVEM